VLTVRAVLFDVDGTLYRQSLLRALMAAELAALPVVNWRRGISTAQILRRYRRVHEDLRGLGAADRPLAAYQIARTADELGVDLATAEATVDEWMVRRPLKYLKWCRRAGLLELLGTLRARGLQLGVLSDYAPEPKLDALEASRYFSLAICTTTSEINALKPHPRGFWRACDMWGLRPEEVMSVGDRPDVDGEGAMAAGLGCVIIQRRGRKGEQRGYTCIRRLDELAGYICTDG
jgi:FMN phosphatase YigB (HAD superfamily)